MKSSNILFILLLATIALATSVPHLHATAALPKTDQRRPTSNNLRGRGRFLADKPRAVMTCDKYPSVCRAKGTSGPDCCNKQCVNMITDKLNCGKCGRKCSYSQMCCQGGCVNPSIDEKHCGRCNSKCKKGGSCFYGLCSYA